MLKGEKDGVMIIKPGHLKVGNTKYGQMISGFGSKVDKNCTLLDYYVSSFLTNTRCIVTQKKSGEHSSYGRMSHRPRWEHEGRHQAQESPQS
jgi:orotate phosphoribosyltransferase-like protein